MNTVLIGLILLSVGAYYVYRDVKAKQLNQIDSLAELRLSPATKCTMSKGEFEGSATGTLNVYKGAALFVVKMTNADPQVSELFVMIEMDGTHLVYPEVPSSWTNDHLDRLLFSFEWSCSPWWIPSAQVFDVPKGS